MASPDSFFSSSPKSKSTVYTPRGSPIDDYVQTSTPSSLILSPPEGHYAGWGALPTHLLDSPQPAKPLTFIGTESITRRQAQDLDELRAKLRAALSVTPGFGSPDLISGGSVPDRSSVSDSPDSSYHDAPLGSQGSAGSVLGRSRYFLDQPSCPSNPSSNTPQSRVEMPLLEVQESRILKIGGIPLEATSLLLFDKLSVGDSLNSVFGSLDS